MTGIVIYLIGIVVQIPFLSTAFYTGPLVEPLGNVDISWIVGLLVPGALYYAFARLAASRAAAACPARLTPPPIDQVRTQIISVTCIVSRMRQFKLVLMRRLKLVLAQHLKLDMMRHLRLVLAPCRHPMKN